MPIAGAFIVPHPPLILPEIGQGREREIALTTAAYREIARRTAVMQPDTVVILSPHSVLYRDYIHISPEVHAEGDFGDFWQPQSVVEADYDAVLTEAVCRLAAKRGVAAGVAGECGHRAFCILAGCLDRLPFLSQLLSYEGPFGVGYAVAAFQDAYVALAQNSLSYYLEHHTAMHVAEEIISNAVSAGVYDPRFPEMTPDELDELICTVDVLGAAEPAESIEELDVKRYGVIVTCDSRRGLLLPNLEEVKTPRQQVDIALKKAGISADEPYTMERFEVVRHY